MNNEFDKHQSEHDKISELYHSLKHELPPPQVDQSILARAKSSCAPANGALAGTGALSKTDTTAAKTASQLKTVSAWRQWQWPVSIAASALLVSVIFIDQYSVLTDTEATYPEAVPLEIEAFSVPAPPPSLPDNAATMQQDSKNEQRARPAVSVSPEIAEQQSAYLAARREAQQSAEAERVQRQHVAQQSQKALQDMAMQHREDVIASKQIARSKPADLSRVVASQIEYLQNKLANKQAMLATINKKQAKILRDGALALQSETSVSLILAEQQELEQQIADLQSQLIKQMGNKQRLQPDWQAPQNLLDLLSAGQRAQWLNQADTGELDKQENKKENKQ